MEQNEQIVKELRTASKTLLEMLQVSNYRKVSYAEKNIGNTDYILMKATIMLEEHVEDNIIPNKFVPFYDLLMQYSDYSLESSEAITNDLVFTLFHKNSALYITAHTEGITDLPPLVLMPFGSYQIPFNEFIGEFKEYQEQIPLMYNISKMEGLEGSYAEKFSLFLNTVSHKYRIQEMVCTYKGELQLKTVI